MAGVIDGRRWLRQRIQHLESELRGDLDDAQRAHLQAQLDQARAQLRQQTWRRWLWWGPRV